MTETLFDIGIIGLGVMGRNLALNLADHGYSVMGLDREPAQADLLKKRFAGKKGDAVTDPAAFVARLATPRNILFLVPAGAPVDACIAELLPLLGPGDLLIDGGNSFFKDTDRRGKALAEKGVNFMGMGISGGESGARLGPSLMPGGPRDAFERVRPMLEAIAARSGNEPCVAWLGAGAAGHFVKMVHNGIEYAIMQLIAETYDFMGRGLGLVAEDLHDVYKDWNRLALSSYLLEITASIFTKEDPKTGKRLVEMISDAARSKGTGKWTSQTAMDLQVPIPTIDAAVAMRDLSRFKEERTEASRVLAGPFHVVADNRAEMEETLRNAYHFATALVFSQGMTLLGKASEQYGFGLRLDAIARVWRGGCIIRATMLDGIAAAYDEKPALPSLLLDPGFTKLARTGHAALRAVVSKAAAWGIPAPAFMASLAYYDGYRSARLPTNLVQAQRDYFGAHTYERTDEKGAFHTEWES